jgi:hypothetical protein
MITLLLVKIVEIEAVSKPQVLNRLNRPEIKISE